MTDHAGPPHPTHEGPLVLVQFYLDCLSHASYLVGDRTTGRAVVVDPQRDVSGYLAEAERRGLAIERVIETHVHADFLSGHLELAQRTGARISYGPAAAVDFATDPLADGEHICLGEVDLEVLHTPGHTPESICLVVRAHAGDAVPYGVLTGDTLFVGDVGRPDLAGASGGLTEEEMARALYRSTRERLLTLPDATRVLPAHGAGSACGKSLSAELSSTIGEQRRDNYALADMTEDAFVAVVTDGQSAAPAYFAFTSIRNRQSRPVLDEEAPVPSLAPDAFLMARAVGSVVVDLRDPEAFAAAHVDGAVNIPLGGRFAELAGQVLDARDPVVLCGDPAGAREARNRLARIGFDHVVGALATPVEAVGAAHLTAAARLDADALARLLAEDPDGARLIDVRGEGEVREHGTIPGAVLIPLPRLLARSAEVPAGRISSGRGGPAGPSAAWVYRPGTAPSEGGAPPCSRASRTTPADPGRSGGQALAEVSAGRPLVVLCASGNRSSVAASVLRARGFEAADLRGGFAAWRGEVARPLEAAPGGGPK